MPKQRDLLIVIADGEHVRFMRPAADNALHRETALDSITAHERSADLGSDRPGASVHTGSSAHHALAPRHDPHLLEKEKFAREIARQINEAAAGRMFAEVVLVAPPHVLSVIRGALTADAQARVVGTLPKDLVNTPDDVLWQHLREWVRPVHRAVM